MFNEKRNKIEIECETKGFEEATEQVETLASAYDSFPPQVSVRNCRDCVINIHPSQTKIITIGDEDEEEDEEEDAISRADTIKAMCTECEFKGECGGECTDVAVVRGMPQRR